MNGYDLNFAPLLPWVVLASALAIGLVLLAWGAHRRLPGSGWRFSALILLLLALANPSIIEEQRRTRPDIALVVVDDSPSQAIGDRRSRSQAALAALRDRITALGDIELRVVEAGREADTISGDAGTQLFTALARARADIPRQRFAGAILITDGQIHDIPGQIPEGPIHALLTGRRGEQDRRLVVVRAPAYGLVDRPVTLTLRVDDQGQSSQPIPISLRLDGDRTETLAVLPNRDTDVDIAIGHGGQNVLELSVPVRADEVSAINNRAIVTINGIRDRLRVLLISGEPHAGERTWRNLLKSDPSVDLVHFTILRPPEKQDGTPISELSLIPFPVRELFEEKLKDFDLVIFDRYRRRTIIPQPYLQAVADYVEAGGALLDASGAAYATPLSLYHSPLGPLLPGVPTGQVIEQSFRPRIADAGQRHPVTMGLPGANPAGSNSEPEWGPWLRLVEMRAGSGQVIMTGPGDRPLLLLDRVGRGRVAQIASDHVWLWSRGYQGGGPQAELLRRIAHWLMKEPALEEEDLSLRAEAGRLWIERRSLLPQDADLRVTDPQGQEMTLSLAGGTGRISAPLTGPGLYRVEDGSRSRLLAVGAVNPKEYADLRTTDQKLAPVLTPGGGGIVWLEDVTGPAPTLRRTHADRDQAGRDWLGLVRRQDYDVTGYRQTPLLPGLVLLVLSLGLIGLAWRREGR